MTGWQLPADLTEDAWLQLGLRLGRLERVSPWWIGDWWAYAEDRSGYRKVLATVGLTSKLGRDAAVVCRRFEPSRRRDTLSFAHHREVSLLDPEPADALLDQADVRGWSARVLRAAVNRQRRGVPASLTTCSTDDLAILVASGKKFPCIYADPPWVYNNQTARAATTKHYGGMSVEELCALPIAQLAAEDGHLHLWCTNAFLFDAQRVFTAWGYEFRSVLVWVKPQMGTGNYWRVSHEFLLTGVRGNAKRFNDRSMMSWIECDRGPHSAKPEQVRMMIERASPGPYLELFGRMPVSGWTVWGDQIERDSFVRAAAE